MDKIIPKNLKIFFRAAVAALVLIIIITTLLITFKYSETHVQNNYSLGKGTSDIEQNNLTETSNNLFGLILPHHRLVEYKIEEYYKKIPENSIETIILIGPNHFNYGFYNIQTTDIISEKYKGITLNLNKIHELQESLGANIQNQYFEKEHSITVHYNLIKKYFPGTTVIPITIKEKTNKKYLDKLIDQLNKLNLNNILIIASIDFSHYKNEKESFSDDNKIINWLKNWEKNDTSIAYEEIFKLAETKTKDTITIDSPESLYIFFSILMNNNCEQIISIERTSSNSLLKSNKPSENTSHIYFFIRK